MDSWAAFTSFDFIGTEDLCVTMDQSERSYQLLGGYAAGQLLYTLQSDPNETMYIVFSPHRSYDSEPPKVKLPTLNATAEHLVACQYKWFLFWDYLLGFCTLINWIEYDAKGKPKIGLTNVHFPTNVLKPADLIQFYPIQFDWFQ